MSAINPGTEPVEDATEAQAAANLAAFAAAVEQRGGVLVGVPSRDQVADVGGRYGFRLHAANGGQIEVLMPGVELAIVRDGLSASVPCLRVNGLAWWWNDAAGQAAGIARPKPE